MVQSKTLFSEPHVACNRRISVDKKRHASIAVVKSMHVDSFVLKGESEDESTQCVHTRALFLALDACSKAYLKLIEIYRFR